MGNELFIRFNKQESVLEPTEEIDKAVITDYDADTAITSILAFSRKQSPNTELEYLNKRLIRPFCANSGISSDDIAILQCSVCDRDFLVAGDEWHNCLESGDLRVLRYCPVCKANKYYLT